VQLSAGTLVITGSISQSTADGTGPASNNPSLNNIQDLQPYSLTLQFSNAIPGAGTFDLTGSLLSLDVAAAAASETQFGSISLTVTDNGAVEDLSLLACIAGADCFAGNELTADFSIPAGSLFSSNAAAVGLDQPHPLELLEDDGITDIQGSITSYSGGQAQASAVPEPSSCFLAAAAALGGIIRLSARRRG
jgi:hypothetical protein